MSAPPRGQRILVLDDDEVMRHLLEALLSLQGFAVTLADSGPAGLVALAGSPPFDLVLTDLQMPGMDPRTLAAALREKMPPGVVLLAMSGTTPDETTRARFDGFLQKPFDGEALSTAVEAAQTARDERTAQDARNAQHGQGAQPTAAVVGASQAPVLDHAIYDSLAKIIPADKLHALYEMTLADILQRHARMEAAAAEGNLLVLRQEAHATKGSCGMVGAQELHNLAAAIEQAKTAETRELSEIPAACKRLRHTLEFKLK